MQAPSGGRSTQITGDSVPKLNQAAVAAGSADIDAVSGATYTSAGYKESLQSALDQAGKAQDSGTQVEAGGDAQDKGEDAEGAEESGAGQATGTQVLTGSAIKTDYGPVQVRVTVIDGKITKRRGAAAAHRRSLHPDQRYRHPPAQPERRLGRER